VIVKLGALEFEATKIVKWDVYNGSTFVWTTKPRDSVDRSAQYTRPIKIQGDHGAVLHAAGVFTGQPLQRKKHRHARDQLPQDE